MAVIAQLSLADPRIDAFYVAAGVTLKDPNGRIVFPEVRHTKPPVRKKAPAKTEEPEDEPEGVFDLFG